MTKQAEQPFSPLVGAVLTHMFEDSAAVTSTVMANYERRILDLEAELWAIRTGVTELLMGPWMPTSEAIRGAVMYPPKVLREEYIAQKRSEAT